MVLAVNLKENYLLDPCVVSSTRSGERHFFSGKTRARVNGPQNGSLHCRGTPESLVRSTQERHCPLQTINCGKKGHARESKLAKEKKAKILAKFFIPIWNTGSTGMKLFVMNSSSRPHLPPICIHLNPQGN